MTNPKAELSKLSEASLHDWVMLLILTCIGGSAFVFIKMAVADFEPVLVSGGRLWVAAILLTVYALSTGRSLPPLLAKQDQKTRIDKRWLFMAAGGLIGYAIPFTLFAVAQLTVSSMLAGIYMAFMPLITIIVAYFFAREKLTIQKIIGFSLGTIGVIFLIGPSALQGIGSSDVMAQLLLVLANLCYAICAVLMRWAPEMPARSFAAGTVLCSAFFMTPLMIMTAQDWSLVNTSGIIAVLYLGVLPSGIASIIIVNLVRKNGAGFMAMANYGTPIIAILLGLLIFSEALKPTFLIGLVAILAGLAISRTKQTSSAGRIIQKLIRPRK